MTEQEIAVAADFEVEMRAEFEQGYSVLRECCIQDAIIGASGAVFHVSGSGAKAQPPTKGAGASINNDLQEICADVLRTSYNIFADTGQGRKGIQRALLSILNRKIDAEIITALDSVQASMTVPRTFSSDVLDAAKKELKRRDVPVGEPDNLFAIITPAARAYLLQVTDFSAGEYITLPYGRGARVYRWAGVNWLMHTGLPGIGTANEHCYLMHRHAAGDAVNSKRLRTEISYQKAADASRCAAYVPHVTTLLQAAGVVRIPHDGSAYECK